MTEQDLDIAKIKETLIEIGKRCGFKATDNLDKIANAKYRFFGADDFRKCPCSRDDEHYCCSQLCQTDVRTKGTCCCKLFEVKDV